MYPSLPISAAFGLLLFTSGLYCDPDLNEKSSRFDALPNCTQAMKSNETAAKLAQCPALRLASNLSDPTDCCQYWSGFNCEKDILYQLPQCSSSRFLIEMQVNLIKPAGICVDPPPSCVNVTHNRAITTVTEDIFRPFVMRMQALLGNPTYENCTTGIKDGLANCLLHFDDLLDQRQSHPDGALCCDELDFKDCAKKVTDSLASCSLARSELDSLYTMMEGKAEKRCPGIGSTCYRSGAPSLSITSPIFNFLLIVAFLLGMST